MKKRTNSTRNHSFSEGQTQPKGTTGHGDENREAEVADDDQRGRPLSDSEDFTTMHPALNILEIVVDVFSYLDKKTLRSLSRTSRSLREPALDLLWREQDSLIPLFKCLPQSRWVEEKTSIGTVLVSRDSLACLHTR